jgi:hypothetical protein
VISVKKRFLSAVITIAMLLSVITGMPTVVSAAEIDFKVFEDLGREFDKLGEQFDDFDIDNLPTQGDPNGNTNDNTEIKTGWDGVKQIIILDTSIPM